MPKLYLAKVNLNSTIFAAYQEKGKIKELMGVIYNSFNNGIQANLVKYHTQTDALGNKKKYEQSFEYSLAEITKNNNISISGRIVRSFLRPNEKLNKMTNKYETEYVKQTTSILFYFDVYNQLITFCERNNFGYKQFLEGMNLLINKSVSNVLDDVVEFETFLVKDDDELKNKIKQIKKVNQIDLIIIPPNDSDEESLEKLRELSNGITPSEEINSKKTTIKYQSDEINMKSKKVLDMQKIVVCGYGNMVLTGKDESGNAIMIDSNKEAAFSMMILSNLPVEEFVKLSKNLMNRFIARKMEKEK